MVFSDTSQLSDSFSSVISGVFREKINVMDLEYPIYVNPLPVIIELQLTENFGKMLSR